MQYSSLTPRYETLAKLGIDSPKSVKSDTPFAIAYCIGCATAGHINDLQLDEPCFLCGSTLIVSTVGYYVRNLNNNSYFWLLPNNFQVTHQKAPCEQCMAGSIVQRSHKWELFWYKGVPTILTKLITTCSTCGDYTDLDAAWDYSMAERNARVAVNEWQKANAIGEWVGRTVLPAAIDSRKVFRAVLTSEPSEGGICAAHSDDGDVLQTMVISDRVVEPLAVETKDRNIMDKFLHCRPFPAKGSVDEIVEHLDLVSDDISIEARKLLSSEERDCLLTEDYRRLVTAANKYNKLALRKLLGCGKANAADGVKDLLFAGDYAGAAALIREAGIAAHNPRPMFTSDTLDQLLIDLGKDVVQDAIKAGIAFTAPHTQPYPTDLINEVLKLKDTLDILYGLVKQHFSFDIFEYQPNFTITESHTVLIDFSGPQNTMEYVNLFYGALIQWSCYSYKLTTWNPPTKSVSSFIPPVYKYTIELVPKKPFTF